jgi:hypothetical protein
MLFDGGPDALDVVVVVELVQKFTDLDAGSFVELGIVFSEVTKFCGDDTPTVFPKPGRNGMNVFDAGDEAGAGVTFGDVIVGLGGDGFEIVGAGLDCGGFKVGRCDRMMGFDEADVIEKKFVAAGAAENALFEHYAHFRCGALMVVGVNLDDNGDLVGSVALEDNVFENHFVVADASAFFDGSLDDIAGDTSLFSFFNRGEEPGVARKIRTAEFGGDADFFGQLAGNFAFALVNDGAFCVEPLTSHKNKEVAVS